MFFDFVIRLDFNKEKLKKSRLKIEKLSALDIMVIENAINAISVSILRHLFDKRLLTLTRGSYIFLTYTNYCRSNVITFVQLFTSCNIVWFLTRINGNRDGFVLPYQRRLREKPFSGKPFKSNSDQHQFSPNISIYKEKEMRTKKLITKGKML